MCGVNVKTTSERYEVFKKSLSCSHCKITGQYFAIERNNCGENYHLNLYGINDEGVEILITKDHIIPHSKGGKNHISNYQTMCVDCNMIKGSKL